MIRSKATSLLWMGMALWLLTTDTATALPGWSYTAELDFSGYTGTETLVNFPALVVITNSPGFAYDQMGSPTGADLRFTDADDTELNYEIERWNPDGASHVWVQIPTLPPGGTVIHAFWGNPSASAPSYTTNGATWSNGYEAVYHLSETNGPHADASPNSNTLAPQNDVQQDVEGRINGATRWPDGSNDWLEAPSHSSLDGMQKLTLETWMYDEQNDTQPRGIFSKRTSASANRSFYLFKFTSRKLYLNIGSNQSDLGNGTITDGNRWYHVAVTFDGSLTAAQRVNAYIDGTHIGTFSNNSTSVPAESGNLTLGILNANYGACWRGLLDEPRISTVARSGDWLQATWRTVEKNDTFCVYGAATTLAPFIAHVEHPTTGSREFTGQLTVDVVIEMTGDFTPVAYLFSATQDEAPAVDDPNWSGTEPDTFTFTSADEGEALVLYAWMKDADDTIEGTQGSIVYTTAAPAAAARNTTLHLLPGYPFSATAIDDGSTGGALADETPIPIDALLLSVGEDEPTATLTLAPGTHTVTLTVVNEAGISDTDTAEVEIVEGVALALFNQETGSSSFINTATVNLDSTILVEDGITLEYAMNETGNDSALSWSTTEPSTFTFANPQEAETQTAYLWVRDQAAPGTVVSTNASIVYTAVAPVVSVVADFTVGVASGQAIDVNPAHLDDGSTGGAVNSTPMSVYSMGIAVGAGTPEDSVTLSTTDPTETFTLTLTVQNEAGNTATDTVDVTLALATSTDNLTWSGGGSTETWAESDNWSAGLHPANPTAGTLTFADADVSDTLAKLLSPVPNWYGMDPTNTWRIGSLRAQNASGEHILDLGGKTLGIVGELRSQRVSTGSANMTIQSGILQVGANIHTDYGTLTLRDLDAPVVLSSATSDIIVNRGAMVVTNAVLPSRFRNLKLGTQLTTTLDMRGGQFENGLLDVDNFEMSVGAEPKSLFYLDGNTLHTIKVRNNFWFVYNGKRAGARIGAPDPSRGNDWYLPYGVNINIGEDGTPGNFLVGHEPNHYQTSDITRFAVSGGGTFEAWLTEFLVGLSGSGHGGRTYVTLDLRGMDAFFMDADSATVGESTGTQGIEARAYLPAGTARFGSLKCGTDVGGTRITELELWGTEVAIETKLELLDSALIVVHVAETGSGLDLNDDIELDITGNPEIRILFTEAPDGSEAHHWGLRQVGDHVAVLGTLYEQDIITMAMAFEGSEAYRVAVYYDDTTGYTYAGLLDADAALPPSILARDITAEAPNATATVRIGPEDLLEAVSNPDELELLDRKLSHPSIASGAELAYLDFPTSSLPVTYTDVTLTYYFDGYTVSDTGDVTFVPMAATTGGNVTWMGAALLQHDPRRAWEWGANWEGGASPANPAATITFADNDLDATHPARLGPIPDWDGATPTNVWTIASLRAGHSSGTHTLDLDGQTLRTTGEVLASRLVATGSGNLFMTNGTLDVGTALRVENGSGIDLSGMGGTLLSIGEKLDVRSSTLTLDGGVVLDGRFEALEVGYSSSAALDLRGHHGGGRSARPG